MTDTETLLSQMATEFVGVASTTGGSDAYLGTIVREGEFFLLDAGGKQPGFRCVFTPFF